MKKIGVILFTLLFFCPSAGFALYIDNVDGTVTDTETGLMWEQFSQTRGDWDFAVEYCDNLTLAGYEDWYLPDLHLELITILDTTTTPNSAPAIDLNYFSNTAATSYWTSTEGTNTYQAYGLMFHNLQSNHANLLNKSNSTVYIRAVRKVQPAPVPEPATLLLLGSGLLAFIGLKKHRKH